MSNNRLDLDPFSIEERRGGANMGKCLDHSSSSIDRSKEFQDIEVISCTVHNRSYL